ncbi:MAG: leucine-rich repeat domain-containing protein [Spirochaetaceae bacterium]|nr:leucine-rich repeat domain-containing protein [Spirochaetaceae bacterium]
MPNSVITIGRRAFAGCRNLASVAIPPSVIVIGQAAFFRCDGFALAALSNRTAIGERAFPSQTRLACRD